MKHILIADDNAMMRSFLSKLLAKEFRVTVFEDGVDLMGYLEKGNQADLILTDLKMPLMNGQKLQLLVNQLHENIPIVFLSGDNKAADRIECISMGALDFIQKPFNPRELKVKITSILHRNTTAQA